MSEEFEVSLDLYDDLIAESEALLEQATSFENIGKFHSFIIPKIWKDNSFHDVKPDEWRNYDGFKFLELHAQVDVREFNPALEKVYERRVQVNAPPWFKKNPDGKGSERIPSDWEGVFVPSILEITNLADANKALKAIEGKYVKIRDVKQQPTKKQPAPSYNTIKFVQLYNSREEAYADYLAMRPNTTETAPVANKSYSDDVVNSVKMLAKLNQSASQIATNIGGGLTESDVNAILKF